MSGGGGSEIERTIDKVADTRTGPKDIQERYALLTPQERGQLVNALNEKSTQERLSTTFPEGTVTTILNKPSLSENDRKIVNELLLHSNTKRNFLDTLSSK